MSSILLFDGEVYSRTEYTSESDLEAAILHVQEKLFGSKRIYLDVKKKIGKRGQQRNIPDGYLIDLTGHRPRLYVVENELESHDPLRHIAVQILQFSLSFEQEPRIVRQILFETLEANAKHKSMCLDFIKQNGLRNFDHFLDELIFNSPFAALVVIDQMPDDLASILNRKFQFGVEVLELARYENPNGQRIYHFEPFLLDVDSDTSTSSEQGKPAIDIAELDTVVVPARRDGFEATFLQENRWYAIRIHATMRPQIKYIAAYQIRPISAITHIAPVASIHPWKDTGKSVVNFAEPAQAIEPIKLVTKGRVKALQNLRYTTIERLENAKNLDDIW